MSWQITLDLDDADAERIPLFARIARVIAQDIARGRLRPGQRLPGTRRLAATLGVHRNTVNAAVDELVAQGWIETRRARGCFVRATPGQERPRPLARSLAPRQDVPERAGFALPRLGPDAAQSADMPGTAARAPLLLSGGLPDPRLFPARCWPAPTAVWSRATRTSSSTTATLAATPVCARRWRTCSRPHAGWPPPPRM